jgi:hypothetical protein
MKSELSVRSNGGSVEVGDSLRSILIKHMRKHAKPEVVFAWSPVLARQADGSNQGLF